MDLRGGEAPGVSCACRVSGTTLFLGIKAVPGASKTEFAGSADGRLRVRIAAAAQGGRANAALAAFLAKSLGCAKKEISVVSGEKSRLKTVSLPARYEDKILGLLGGGRPET